jgi:hypothetical protein
MNAVDFINLMMSWKFRAMMKSLYNSLEQNIRFISENTNTKQICVTTKVANGVHILMKNLQ